MSRFLCSTVVLTLILAAAFPLRAQTAAAYVEAYEPGTGAGSYTDPNAALGTPERLTDVGGAYQSVLSPFNPNWTTDSLVAIGDGGSLTLRLERFAVITPGQYELGVFTNISLTDINYPFGQASSATPPGMFGVDSAIVEVSADGLTYYSLGEITFNMPANGWADATSPYQTDNGTVPSDFGQPYTAGADSFSGLDYEEILTALDGSGGGYWLDLDAYSLPISEVGWVRFTVAEGYAGNFELDAVTVNNATTGSYVVPEPGTASALLLAGSLLLGWRRRARA